MLTRSLRPCLLTLALALAAAGPATAGMVGFNVLPTDPAPNGSIDVRADGSIVGTNINVPLVYGTAVTGSTPVTYSINAYLDFQTGALLSTDADGTKHFSSANADFFILGGILTDPVHGAHSPPLAYSVDLLPTLLPPTATSPHYQLVATLLSAYLDPDIAAGFGLVGGFKFDGTFSLAFDFNSKLAGKQVAGGSIAMAQTIQPSQATPAPPSVVLAGLGLVATTARRLRRRAA